MTAGTVADRPPSLHDRVSALWRRDEATEELRAWSRLQSLIRELESCAPHVYAVGRSTFARNHRDRELSEELQWDDDVRFDIRVVANDTEIDRKACSVVDVAAMALANGCEIVDLVPASGAPLYEAVGHLPLSDGGHVDFFFYDTRQTACLVYSDDKAWVAPDDTRTIGDVLVERYPWKLASGMQSDAFRRYQMAVKEIVHRYGTRREVDHLPSQFHVDSETRHALSRTLEKHGYVGWWIVDARTGEVLSETPENHPRQTSQDGLLRKASSAIVSALSEYAWGATQRNAIQAQAFMNSYDEAELGVDDRDRVQDRQPGGRDSQADRAEGKRDPTLSGPDHITNLLPADPTGKRAVYRIALGRAIRAARLAWLEAAVWWRVDFEERTVTDTATELGVSPSTVDRALRRARNKFASLSPDLDPR